MIDMPPQPPSAHEQVIEQRLVACGLDVKGLSVAYRDYLQGLEVVIKPAAGATSAHFGCIFDAIGNEIVLFEDPAMFAAYDAFASERVRPWLMAQAEKRLKERGLWDALPERSDFASLEDYAKALEKHSGLAQGTALRVQGGGILFDPAGLGAELSDDPMLYSDLFAVVSYAITKERISFGIIGNERVGE